MTSEIIAIDGPAGSGKSTVAKEVAEKLGWSFLDTGAMYRAVTCEAISRGVDIANADEVAKIADTAIIETIPRTTINGRDVHDQIRTSEINQAVSVVAANVAVRAAMVQRQRELAAKSRTGVVVEGRDITTVVFPEATLKIFLTASLEERARRRGDESASSVARRDQADSSREASPLTQADDAVVLDTTGLSIDQVVEEIIQCLKNIA